jgi:hypothetical protein
VPHHFKAVLSDRFRHFTFCNCVSAIHSVRPFMRNDLQSVRALQGFAHFTKSRKSLMRGDHERLMDSIANSHECGQCGVRLKWCRSCSNAIERSAEAHRFHLKEMRIDPQFGRTNSMPNDAISCLPDCPSLNLVEVSTAAVRNPISRDAGAHSVERCLQYVRQRRLSEDELANRIKGKLG